MKSITYIFLAVCVLLSSCKKDNGYVVGKIKKASKLSTTEFNIDKIVFGVKKRKLIWLVKLNDAQFIAYSKAIIKAGIDLEKLQEKDVAIDGSKISLMLPPVEVINFSYPAENFKRDSLISGNAFMNKITLSDQEDFFQDAESDIRNNLKYLNIVSITEKKTALMLETMLRALGYEEIYIDFKKSEVLIPEIKPEE
jgi:hypothetical protein